jgi:DNA ligase-1
MPTLNIITADSEEIRMDQTPVTTKWKLVPLYKESMNGGMLMWQVGFDGNDHLEMTHGYTHGAIRTDRTEVKLNSSGRTMKEQALLVARRRYQDKFKEGYLPAGSTAPPMKKGMKGYDYKPGSIKTWPVETQPKLDGIRILTRMVGSQLKMMSYTNNEFTKLTHMHEEIMEFLTYLPANTMLDGEAYTHGMNFTTLSSAIRRQNTVHPRLHEVQYHLFDIDYQDMAGTEREKRQALLVNAYNQWVHDRTSEGKPHPYVINIVPSSLAQTHEEVMQHHYYYVQQGYEGVMIKKRANGFSDGTIQHTQSLYKAGKSNHILKYKDFKDEEGVILEVTEAEGNQKGAALFLVQDMRGNRFTVGLRGEIERRRRIFLEPERVIGKEITFRYQPDPSYSAPRFPVGIAIRDYE